VDQQPGRRRRVLYRLPELLAADPAAPVFLVEGEKDGETPRALGLIATTNPMGAAGWKREYAVSLAGRTVIICPDYDTPGMRRDRQIERDLTAAGIAWGTIELPGLTVTDKHGADVTDGLNEHGGTKERLMELAAAALAAGAVGKAELTELASRGVNSANLAFPRTRPGPPPWSPRRSTGRWARL
jgi:DNA primase